MNTEPLRCARPGCGRPFPEHRPTAPGCPGFLWVDPGRPPDHPRWTEEEVDTPPPG